MKQQILQRECVLRVLAIVLQFQTIALMLARAATAAHVLEMWKAHSHVPVTPVGQEQFAASKFCARMTAMPFCVIRAYLPLVVVLACRATGTQKTTCCQAQPVICCR